MFFALWPPRPAAAALHDWASVAHAKIGGRVTRAATIHLTLAFLGDVEAERVPALIECGKRVQASPFELWLDERRWWKHNQIAWAGPSAMPAGLRDLAAHLDLQLKAAAFPTEKREFKAHVTLLRRAELRPGDSLPPLDAVRWQAGEFVLVRSALAPEGPSYEVVERFPLA